MAIKGNPFATPRKASSRMSAREAERVYLGEAELLIGIQAKNETELANRETEHKPNTGARANWTQTAHKLDTNWTQTAHKVVTNRTHNRTHNRTQAFLVVVVI